jgi:S1-C subfamily serine protease
LNAIDWAIVVFAVLLIPLGWRQGLIVGVLTLLGFAAGAFLGSRLGPLVLAEGSESPYAPLTALAGGLFLGGIFAVVLEGLGIALRDRFVARGAGRAVDAAGGAVIFAVLALTISWVMGAVVLNAPAFREYRADVQRSKILAALNETFPPSGPLLNVLNSIDPTPELRGPSADVAAPEKGIVADPEVEAAAPSVVRVLGTACGLSITGSGWVGAPEVVVTNAHVVAGEDETQVETQDGSLLDAFAVFYDPRDDLAVLRVPGLASQPLALDPGPRRGAPGAIAGFPGGGPFTFAAARLGTTGTVTSEDSYGRGPIERKMTSFRGEVRSGNSGGPVIDGDGEVLTTVFASALGGGAPEGLGVPNSVTERALNRLGDAQVDTGPCV